MTASPTYRRTDASTKRALAAATRKLRSDLLKLERALERDDDLSDYQASNHFDSARHFWKYLADRLGPEENK